jgi:hypothetical protein
MRVTFVGVDGQDVQVPVPKDRVRTFADGVDAQGPYWVGAKEVARTRARVGARRWLWLVPVRDIIARVEVCRGPEDDKPDPEDESKDDGGHPRTPQVRPPLQDESS